MKNIYCLLFFWQICFIAGAQLLTQPGNQWNVAVFATFSPNTGSFRLKIEGDTLINNLHYKKIYRSGSASGDDWNALPDFIREDFSGKIFLKEQSMPEFLLYDFTLIEGDTFHATGACAAVVTAVDSVNLADGTRRKRLKLVRADAQTFGDENFWIEGIGSTGGLLTHFWGLCFTDYPEFLLCFHENDNLQFQPEPSLSCFIVSTDEISDENKIKIYPNPAAAVLTVEMPESGTADIFSVSDFTGKCLKTESINLGEKTINIPVNDLPPGIYLFQLNTGGRSLAVYKFAVMR